MGRPHPDNWVAFIPDEPKYVPQQYRPPSTAIKKYKHLVYTHTLTVNTSLCMQPWRIATFVVCKISFLFTLHF